MTLSGIAKVVAIIALIGLVFVLGAKWARRGANEGTKTQIDTVYIRDTIIVKKAISVTKRVVDSVFVKADTVRMRDTLFVYLEREQVKWQDSLSTIYASGINPRIDSVFHYPTTMVVTKTVTERPKRFGIGLQGGIGIGKDGITPYVGVGISYNLIRF